MIRNETFEKCTMSIISLVTSLERHGFPDQPQLDIFKQLFQAKYNENFTNPNFWPFQRAIHRWYADSPHKGPLVWKTLPCYDITTELFAEAIKSISRVWYTTQRLNSKWKCNWKPAWRKLVSWIYIAKTWSRPVQWRRALLGSNWYS